MPLEPLSISIGMSEEEVNELLNGLQHNNLNGIQGGNAAERYHLTQAQVTKLNDAASSSDVIKLHNNLQGLQGGSQNERYHLTQAQVTKLDGAASASDVIKVHNNLQGLQGGTQNERYHLTAVQVEKLNSAASSSDVIKVHNNLQGLQGGSQNERYHLTLAELQKLQSGGTNDGQDPYCLSSFVVSFADSPNSKYIGDNIPNSAYPSLPKECFIKRRNVLFTIPDGVSYIRVYILAGTGGEGYRPDGELGFCELGDSFNNEIKVSPGDVVGIHIGNGAANYDSTPSDSLSGFRIGPSGIDGVSSFITINGQLLVYCNGSSRRFNGNTTSYAKQPYEERAKWNIPSLSWDERISSQLFNSPGLFCGVRHAYTPHKSLGRTIEWANALGVSSASDYMVGSAIRAFGFRRSFYSLMTSGINSLTGNISYLAKGGESGEAYVEYICPASKKYQGIVKVEDTYSPACQWYNSNDPYDLRRLTE